MTATPARPVWYIVRDFGAFHAVNDAIGFRSSRFTSASQAGLIIERKAGKEAHRAAALHFLGVQEA